VTRSLLSFEQAGTGGLTWHVITAGDEDIPEACWTRLVTGDYPDDEELNPFFRFSVNNVDGEFLAVWRALAWAITRAPACAALPRYDRDRVAAYLHRERESMTFVRWEYSIDYELHPFAVANRGFVPARSCIPIRPQPTQWEVDHKHLAGIFDVPNLNAWNTIDAALSFDVASEVSLIGLTAGTLDGLTRALNDVAPPHLDDVLEPEDIFAHLSIVRDRFLGHRSYLAVAAHRDVTAELDRLSRFYAEKWTRYVEEAGRLDSFSDWVDAMERLISPPTS